MLPVPHTEACRPTGLRRLRRAGWTCGLIGLLATALPAQQAQYHEEPGWLVREISGTLTGPARFRVLTRSDLGDIHVQGVPGTGLRYQIRIRSRAGSQARALVDGVAVVVRRRGDRIELRTAAPRLPGGSPWNALDVQLELGVPAGAESVSLQSAVGNIVVESLETPRFSATAAAGNIRVERLQGAARIATASGSIRLGRVTGGVWAHTAGGNIAVQDAGGEVQIASQGGNLQVGHAGGAVRAATAAGAISVDSAGGAVTATTAGGNITLGHIAGAVRTQTAGGNIRVQAAGGAVTAATAGGNIELHEVDGAVRAETAAGAIMAEIIAPAARFGASSLVSAAGAISVRLPAHLPVTVRAVIESPRGHRLVSDFKELASPYSEPDGEQVAGEGRLNGGGPVLRLVATGADITIHRGP